MANNERRLSRFQTLILVGTLASQLAACAKAGDNRRKAGTDNGVDNNPKPAEVANGGEVAHAGVIALPISEALLPLAIQLPAVKEAMAAGFVVTTIAAADLGFQGAHRKLCQEFQMVPAGSLGDPYCVSSAAAAGDPHMQALAEAAYAATMAEAANIEKVVANVAAATTTTIQRIDQQLAGQLVQQRTISTQEKGPNNERVEIYARVNQDADSFSRAEVVWGAVMMTNDKVIFIVVKGGAVNYKETGCLRIGNTEWYYDPTTIVWSLAQQYMIGNGPEQITWGEGLVTWEEAKKLSGLVIPVLTLQLR